MMRIHLLLSVVLCSLALVAAVPGNVDNPNTPPNGGAGETMCLLDGLLFTNGLKLTKSFVPNRFTYTCTADWGTGKFTTQVIPHMMDDSSSAEITFNGRKINFRNPYKNAISNNPASGAALNSPNTRSDVLEFVTGVNTIVIGVGCNGYGVPETCYYQYTISCTKPKDGSIVGDPQFVGLRGQNYQIHGVAGEIYNIVSDADLQYNSRFVFLTHGSCPIVDGKKQKGCFSHPGSYLGELGLKTRAGDKIHLVTGPAAEGFAKVEVNGKPIDIGQTVLLADDLGSVSRNSTHLASVNIGNWDFAFENSDMFANQRVRVLDARKLRSHGLLGQTWRETTYPNAIKYIQGQVDDYVIREKDIFGDNFLYNKFN